MKLRTIQFSFEEGIVIYKYEPHEWNGKKYTYHVESIRNGVRNTWHVNANANKSNAILLLRDTKA